MYCVNPLCDCTQSGLAQSKSVVDPLRGMSKIEKLRWIPDENKYKFCFQRVYVTDYLVIYTTWKNKDATFLNVFSHLLKV